MKELQYTSEKNPKVVATLQSVNKDDHPNFFKNSDR